MNSPYLRGHNDQVFFVVHVAIVEHLLWEETSCIQKQFFSGTIIIFAILAKCLILGLLILTHLLVLIQAVTEGGNPLEQRHTKKNSILDKNS